MHKGQIITLDFIDALAMIIIIYLFFSTWFANRGYALEQEKKLITLYGDSEKIAMSVLSFGSPYLWTATSGTPGLLCLNLQICDSKINRLRDLCSSNYSRLKDVWGLDNNFTLTLYNATYSDCLCNCGAVDKKLMSYHHISVPYNDSVYGMRIGTFSYK